MKQFKKLTQDNHHYEINSKLIFGQRARAICHPSDLSQAFLFSWQMTFGRKGEHRSTRSGGQLARDHVRKFCDIFLGKLGEVAFFNLCQQRNKSQTISPIDYECYTLGKWDSADFIINDQYHIAIKTTKHFGNLLLLEYKDWCVQQNQAIYLPNVDAESKGKYDYLFFSRVKTNLSELLKNISFSHEQSIDDIHTLFFNHIFHKVNVALEVVGYISNQDLVTLMKDDYILPQHAILNGNTVMDAKNYYLQSGFFKPFFV